MPSRGQRASVEWTHVSCPLCGADVPSPVLVDNVRRGDDTYGFHVVSCRQCACVYVTPRGRSSLFGAEAGGAARRDAASANEPIYASGLNGLRESGLLPGASIVDLGCARGDFLAFAEKEGFAAQGIDINAGLSEEARARGFVVHTGDLRDLRLPQAVDAVTMWDVIEHVGDPVALVEACRDILVPGGLLLFHTGNARFQVPKARVLNAIRPNGGPYMIPYQHLVHFDPSSARRVLERAGLEPVRVFSAGTLHYRRRWKRLMMRSLNAAGSLPPVFGGPLHTNALAAIGRRPRGPRASTRRLT